MTEITCDTYILIFFSFHSGLDDTCNCLNKFKYFKMGQRESSFQLCCTERDHFSPSTSPGKFNDLKPFSGMANYRGVRALAVLRRENRLYVDCFFCLTSFLISICFLFITENHRSATSSLLNVLKKHGN